MKRTYSTIEAQLMHHEGLRLKPYLCSAGKLTLGIGRNIQDKGISEEEAIHLFKNDMAECLNDMRDLFGIVFWETLLEGRRRALLDLRFNIGPGRFRGFKKMIAAILAGEWKQSAEELKDSKWWGQVQEDRRDTLYNQIQTGAQ